MFLMPVQAARTNLLSCPRLLANADPQEDPDREVLTALFVYVYVRMEDQLDVQLAVKCAVPSDDKIFCAAEEPVCSR